MAALHSPEVAQKLAKSEALVWQCCVSSLVCGLVCCRLSTNELDSARGLYKYQQWSKLLAEALHD
jgi:hypothetical protein